MNCPSCGTRTPPQAEFCPQCLGGLAPRASVPEKAVASALPEFPAVAFSGASPAVATPPLAAPEVTSLCPEHPTMPAAGTCTPCGSFYCIRCVPEAATVQTAQCPRCRATLAVQEAHEKIQRHFQKLWVTPLLMGMGVLSMFAALPPSSVGGLELEIRLTLGLAAGLPFALVAFLIPLTQSLKVAWISVVIQLLGLGLMLLGNGVGGVALLLIIAPILTTIRIHKIEELQAILRAQPAELTPRPQG